MTHCVNWLIVTYRRLSNNIPGTRLRWALAFVLVLALLTGCGKEASTGGQASPSSPNRIVIKGSNTVGEELAPRLITEFKKDHPQVSIELETKGSGSGFWALIAGVCDIAASSRTMLKDEQQQASFHGMQLIDCVIGAYSVAVVVNSANSVTNLAHELVRDIFTGVITNWEQVGAPNATIHLFIRNPVSGTYLGFRELALDDKPYATNNVVELTSYDAIVQMVAKDPNAIGYVGMNLTSAPGVKPISVGGVLPRASSVQAVKYRYARVLHLFTNKDTESPLARDFIQFVQSTRGQQIVSEMGYVTKTPTQQ